VPVRVPPLTPDKVAEFSTLFERSGAQGDILPGMENIVPHLAFGRQVVIIAVSQGN
jgi:hypothetical protein